MWKAYNFPVFLLSETSTSIMQQVVGFQKILFLTTSLTLLPTIKLLAYYSQKNKNKSCLHIRISLCIGIGYVFRKLIFLFVEGECCGFAF